MDERQIERIVREAVREVIGAGNSYQQIFDILEKGMRDNFNVLEVNDEAIIIEDPSDPQKELRVRWPKISRLTEYDGTPIRHKRNWEKEHWDNPYQKQRGI